MRMIVLWLAAMLAIAAVVASVASAAAKPEWGQCFAKEGGKYKNSSCTEKASKGGGAFEWRKSTEVAKKGFTGAGGRGLLYTDFTPCTNACVNAKGEETEEGKKFKEEGDAIPVAVECTSEAATGEASGKNGVKDVNVTFRGCTLAEEFACSNTANAGEITTHVLKGELGVTSKSKNEVGVLLTPEVKHGTFAQFSCTIGLSTEVGVVKKHAGPPANAPKGGNDQIISPITPINEMSSEFTQEYKVTNLVEGHLCDKCTNTPEKFEGKKMSGLEAYIFNTEKPEDRGFWENAGEEIVNVNTPEEAVEIRD